MGISKSDVYEILIDIQKATGQGLSGIVKIKSFDYSKYLDELINDGLVEGCHTGGSLGHYESNVFYVPTKGYNVWKDNDPRALTFVRIFLDIIPKETKSIIEPGLITYLQDPEYMVAYSEWLGKNINSLKEMLELDNVLPTDVNNQIVDDKTGLLLTDIEWVKERTWYKENLTITNCLKISNERMDKDLDIIDINKKLLGLYKTDPERYSNDIDEVKVQMVELKSINDIRGRVNEWLQSQKKRTKIKDLI